MQCRRVLHGMCRVFCHGCLSLCPDHVPSLRRLLPVRGCRARRPRGLSRDQLAELPEDKHAYGGHDGPQELRRDEHGLDGVQPVSAWSNTIAAGEVNTSPVTSSPDVVSLTSVAGLLVLVTCGDVRLKRL